MKRVIISAILLAVGTSSGAFTQAPLSAGVVCNQKSQPNDIAQPLLNQAALKSHDIDKM